MVRGALVLLLIAACDPAASSSARPVYPLADEPPPPPGERCYRERFEVRGRPIEMRLRLAIDPPAGQATIRVSEHEITGTTTWTTVMQVDGARFTAVERGPEGEAAGEGILLGPAWAWSGWQTVIHRPDGFAERSDASVGASTLTITSEVRAADGAVASTGERSYRKVACATLGDAPIETLYPKPQP